MTRHEPIIITLDGELEIGEQEGGFATSWIEVGGTCVASKVEELLGEFPFRQTDIVSVGKCELSIKIWPPKK